MQSKIIELKQALDRILQENAILRKKFESEKINNQNLRDELNGYKQTIQGLESTMLDATSQPNQVSSQNEVNQSMHKNSSVERKKHKFTSRKESLQSKID